MSMNLFARLTKVDEEKRTVTGRATQEVLDRSGEIFDYASSKPFFEKWSGEISKSTDGKSLGNLRAMHGNVAAGKLTAIDFNDTDKAIDIVTKVVDEAEWQKVLEGVYTGFSIGGSYHKRWTDAEKATRFTADPCEISLVDLPCVPTASFFDIQKVDGSVMHKVFKVAETPQVTAVEELAKLLDSGEVTPEAVLAMIKASAAPAADPIVDPAAPVIVALDPTPEVLTAVSKAGRVVVLTSDNLYKAGRLALAKNMDRVSSMSFLLGSIQRLQQGSAAEEAREGDDSTMPADLLAWLKQGGDLLIAMVTEEVGELVDDQGNVCAPDVYYCEWAAAVDGLVKAAALETDGKDFLQKVGARNSKNDAERVQKAHDLLADLGASCDSGNTPADDAAKLAGASLQKLTSELAVFQITPDTVVEAVTKAQAELTAANEALVKVADERDAVALERDTLTKAQETLTQERDELTKQVETLKKAPAAPKGALMAISKSHDLVTEAMASEEEVDPILKSDGTVDEVATAIKKARRAGGVAVQRG
jgi:hypothetical protein